MDVFAGPLVHIEAARRSNPGLEVGLVQLPRVFSIEVEEVTGHLQGSPGDLGSQLSVTVESICPAEERRRIIGVIAETVVG